MAVHDRRYKPYRGRITPLFGRFLVLPRFAFKDVFKSRFLVFFYGATLLVPLVFGLIIYLRNNLDALDSLRAMGFEIGNLFSIDEGFFARFLGVQAVLAFFLTLFIGPGLVSRDLANNGLPLFLSRPISRADYVLGKLAILLTLLSSITWLAGLGLFALNGNMTTWGWMFENLHIAAAIFVGSWLWIGLLALLALALSAWVKWKVIAGFMLLVFFVAGDFFSLIVLGFFKSNWGFLAQPDHLIMIITARMLGISPPPGPPLVACIIALVVAYAICLFMLNRRIRAYQVVS